MISTPSLVKYVDDGTPGPQLEPSPSAVAEFTEAPASPFLDYQYRNDQALTGTEQRVIDRSTSELRRFIVDDTVRNSLSPAPTAANDFVNHVLRLLPNDDGFWRTRASVQLERVGGLTDPANPPSHRIELRLYKNGIYDSLIASSHEPFLEPQVVGDPSVVVIEGAAISTCVEGDVLQVRIFNERPTGETYEIQFTGEAETTSVTFERIES